MNININIIGNPAEINEVLTAIANIPGISLSATEKTPVSVEVETKKRYKFGYVTTSETIHNADGTEKTVTGMMFCSPAPSGRSYQGSNMMDDAEYDAVSDDGVDLSTIIGNHLRKKTAAETEITFLESTNKYDALEEYLKIAAKKGLK